MRLLIVARATGTRGIVQLSNRLLDGLKLSIRTKWLVMASREAERRSSQSELVRAGDEIMPKMKNAQQNLTFTASLRRSGGVWERSSKKAVPRMIVERHVSSS
jgi:hypothetical protein